MMSRAAGWTKVPNWLYRSPRVSLHAIVVFGAINSFANNDGVCWPSHRQIASRAKCSVTTVKKAIKELTSYGVLSVEHRVVNGEHTSNIYRVSLQDPDFAYEDAEGAGGGDVATQVSRKAPNLEPDATHNKSQLNKIQLEEHSHRPPDSSGEATAREGGAEELHHLNEEFADFYGIYPRKGCEPSARRAYRSARSRGVAHDTIMRGLRDQLEYLGTFDEEFVPLAHNWLLGWRWEDELA